MNKQGTWQLAPAYDLTFSYSAHGYHSTTIAGVGKQPTHNDLIRLGETFGMENVHDIIGSVKTVTDNYEHYLRKHDVSEETIKEINAVL